MVSAGAASLCAPAWLATRPAGVLVLDHNDKLAEKSASLAAAAATSPISTSTPSAIYPSNPHFVHRRWRNTSGLYCWSNHGISPRKTLGQLFCDDSAQQIIDLLDAECADGGVTRRLGCAIRSVARSDDGRFVRPLPTANSDAESLVVATGGTLHPRHQRHLGPGWPEQFGLAVTPLKPAGAADLRRRRHNAFGPLASLSPGHRRQPGQAFREQRPVHPQGVSGPACKISSYWQTGQTIELDLPSADAHDLLGQAVQRAKTLRCWHKPTAPSCFAVQWLQRPKGVAETPYANSPQNPGRAGRTQSTPGPSDPAARKGYKKAEVTVGGVDTQELSSKTLMANKAPGLFLLGKVSGCDRVAGGTTSSGHGRQGMW